MTNSEYETKIECYRRDLENFIFSKTKNYELTQEVVQHSLIKAFKYCKTGFSANSYKNWLYKIAVNTLIDFLREKNKLTTISINNAHDDEQSDIEIADSFSFDEHIDKMIIKKTINDGLTAMKNYNENIYKIFIKSLDYDNYSIIANEENIPLATVKTRVHRGKKFMQKYIDENGITI